VQINPSRISKFNTVAQISTIFFILLTKVVTWQIDKSIYIGFYLITAVLTVGSACQYAYRGLNLIQNNR
jgi:phosphatidylglycerophosphate synthase